MQRLRDDFIGWSLAFAFYLWVVDEATVPEAAAGALVALATTLVLGRLAAVAPDRARAGTRVLKPLARVPVAAVRESAELLGPVLFRRLRGEDVRGRWIALRYSAADPDDRERARRLFVIFASNLTPNALPLAIDPDSERFAQHQLVHRREAAASDPVFPV